VDALVVLLLAGLRIEADEDAVVRLAEVHEAVVD
jgi:hypothetical protein